MIGNDMVFGLMRTSNIKRLEKVIIDLQNKVDDLKPETKTTEIPLGDKTPEFTSEPTDYSDDPIEAQLIKDYLASKNENEAKWRYSKLNYYRRQNKTTTTNQMRATRSNPGSTALAIPTQAPKDLANFIGDVIKFFPIPHNKWMDLFGITPEKLSVEAAKFIEENRPGLETVWREAVKPWFEKWTSSPSGDNRPAAHLPSGSLQPLQLS